MPLVMLDAYPSDQVIFNTDDIILAQPRGAGCEIILRGEKMPVLVPHSVTDLADALTRRENLVAVGTCDPE